MVFILRMAGMERQMILHLFPASDQIIHITKVVSRAVYTHTTRRFTNVLSLYECWMTIVTILQSKWIADRRRMTRHVKICKDQPDPE